MDVSQLDVIGARPAKSSKYSSLCTYKFIAGLQTQRSPFASIDNRYSAKYLGGKPDALIAGSNVEISNKLTMTRRPGTVAYGTSSIPAPDFFFNWQQATLANFVSIVDPTFIAYPQANLQLIVDTATNGTTAPGSIYNYSPTFAGIILNKAVLSGQTSFYDVVNTMYMGDGVDLYKMTGANLLTQSNNYGSGGVATAPWSIANVTLLTGRLDPTGGSTATRVTWGTTGPTALIKQTVTPNYTPVASNTFTFSVWMARESAGSPNTISIEIDNQASALIATKAVAVTANYALYQVTGTMGVSDTGVQVFIYNPTTTNNILIYGAQLEVGGPATPSTITTNKPNGVYLWGIQAPTVAPTFTIAQTTGSTGKPWQPNHTYSLNDTIVDSNGNLQTVTTAGKSGATQPVWAVVQGAVTNDGLQNLIVQTASVFSRNASASVAFNANVTGANTKLIFVASYSPGSLAVTDSSGDVPTLLTSQGSPGSSLFKIYVYYVLNATAGATTISVTGGGASGTWLGITEMATQSATDGSASNTVKNNSSPFFLSGSVTTTNQPDILVSFAAFIDQTSGFELGSVPAGYQTIVNLPQTNIPNGFWNIAAAFQVLLTTPVSVNPQWTITNVNAGSDTVIGITGAFKSSVGTLVWTNGGQTSVTGVTAKTSYQYLFSFVNTATGHRSNVSVASASTGAIAGAAITVTGPGMRITPSGAAGQDPQVDAIEVYRNTDGGGFWYQIPANLMTSPSGTIIVNGVTYLANPGTVSAAGTWSFIDKVLDNQLNTQIFAPIAFLNSPPPAGLTNLEFFDGRLWGSVANILYYATAADDATLVNVLQNGVSPESWEPTNFIPFNSAIVRSVATAVGLIVFTTTDVHVVQGTNLATYNPVKVLTGVGLGTYNGLCIDGSTLMMYTRDRQCLMFNVSSGAAEIGFLIGDLIEANINPMSCYLARHIKGSQDNAFYFADGASGWFRLNPNQYGASASGEQTPVWSPFATIAAAGACGAIASIEVQPGIKMLLVGQAVTNTGLKPILNRDITVFSDNGTKYSWSATIGSIMLALPGKLAEIESITTEMISATATQCGVAVLIDEISGTFETLGGTATNPTPDPPGYPASASVLANRFYLSPGTVPPIGRHCQVQLTGTNAVATRDELLALTIRGCAIEEQA